MNILYLFLLERVYIIPKDFFSNPALCRSSDGEGKIVQGHSPPSPHRQVRENARRPLLVASETVLTMIG